ncbi:MAG: hypothetical protein A2293_06175 [Elusimicrobia bacterium RIFOXYB2_FULL_49_7]|nr:MAG: hypothetical protein A2293_06175 [Elusimicrobia bacterium RIFOXYB2_FULL_49_7]
MKIDQLHRLFQKTFSGLHAKRITAALYRHSRKITWPEYAEAARLCADKMRRIGLQDVELLSFPIDGKKCYGNWRSPRFWDVRQGYLDIKVNGTWERFADYSKIPTSLFVYTAPTKGEIRTKLVLPNAATLAGRLVWCEPTEDNRKRLQKKKAAGIATDFSPNWEGVRSDSDFRNGHRWDNNFLFEAQTPLAGFSLSRHQGERLRTALKSERELECAFRIDGKLGKGVFWAATGAILGTTHRKEEVISVAHLYEAGANDNCSGIAASIEALHAIQRLIERGRLPRPERTLRIIFAFEIVGFLAYFEKMRKKGRSYFAGINPDMVGEDQEKCHSTLHIYQAPDSTVTFANPLLLHLIRQAAARKLNYTVRKFIINDNSVTDPTVGPPCTALIHLRDRFYHSNEDSPDKVSVDTLQRLGGALAVYLYVCGSSDKERGEEMGRLCVDYACARLAVEAKTLSAEKRCYLLERESARLRTIPGLSPRSYVRFHQRMTKRIEQIPVQVKSPPYETDVKHRKEAEKWIPIRQVAGTLTFEHLPPDKRSKLPFQPVWSNQWNLPLFWVDGKRSLWEVYRLSSLENGSYSLRDFLDYFKLLAKEKLIKLKKTH